MQKINIAIDGFSSCGKSTLAKDLARKLNYIYTDTGAMYRAITLYGMKNGCVSQEEIDSNRLIKELPNIDVSFTFNKETGKSETYLNGENVEEEIREMAVSSLVSRVSVISEVREKLVHIQQKTAKDKGVVMDGRDIGSVVLPDAELKLFMTADEEIRAQRRFSELKQKKVAVTFEEVIENIRDRDHNDTVREKNPLKQADDAIVLDNSHMTISEQDAYVMKLVEERLVD